MLPHSLGLGALLAALTQLSPWAFLGLLIGLRFDQTSRWMMVGAYGLVLLRILTLPDPWTDRIGQPVELEGRVVNSFLSTPQGRIYVRHFPRLQDGRYKLSGTLQAPQTRRNPGGFDQKHWLKGLGIQAVLRVNEVKEFEPLPPSLRSGLQGNLKAGLSPPVAALAEAMTLGERRELGELYGEFQKSGLAHALALSGLNVAILAAFFAIVFFKFGPNRYLISLLILLAYLFLAGSTPSLLRAVIMGGAVLIGLWLGRGKVEVFAALFLALFIHLLLEPYSILSLSFQLSYLAVLGMAVVLPKVSTPKGWKGWAVSALVVTLAAQVFILPILLHQFHQLPLVSPLANLVVLPLLNLLVPLGFVKMFLGGLLALPFEWVGSLTLWLVGWFAKGPQLYWGQISPVGFGLYYLALLPFLAGLYKQISWPRAGVLGGTAALSSLVSLTAPQAEIWQLDVGQGDASLIRLPGNIEVLVDGGRGFAGNRVIGALRALGIDDLDAVVATHADADHIQALPEVLQALPVGTLFTGPVIEGDLEDIALRKTAGERKVRVEQARAGTTVKLGPATLRFVGPQGSQGETNDLSLVFVLEYRSRRALFTGDAPDWAEPGWQVGPMDVLKVGHHGSRSSTSEELLQKTRPKIALIGVGPNTYGHPTRAVLERLSQYGVEVRRTDLEGAVRIGLR